MAVYKVGINDSDQKVREDGKIVKEYALWTGMFERCSVRGATKCPAYLGCNVSDNFKRYSYFYEWCNKQSDGKGKAIKLGRFDTPEDAFQAYKTAKEASIKNLAIKWKDKIDNRLYLAMMCYIVDITD